LKKNFERSDQLTQAVLENNVSLVDKIITISTVDLNSTDSNDLKEIFKEYSKP